MLTQYSDRQRERVKSKSESFRNELCSLVRKKNLFSLPIAAAINALGRMGAEAGDAEPTRAWGAWEELILGGAVLRHGTQDWNVVVSELRARADSPHSFTPEVCKAKYEELQKRYSDSRAWFDELRKQRVAELKRELERSEDSIGFLESKIKYLERNSSSQANYDSSQTESPLPALDSGGTQSSSKDQFLPKDELSAGSFTNDATVFSSELDKDSGIEKPTEAGHEQMTTTRKKRGQRKKIICQTVNLGSVEDRDNLDSSNVVSTTQKESSSTDCCIQISRESDLDNQTKNSDTVEGHNLMEIFQSIELSEPASVFRHRMDSQKRTRYRKVIRQHLDIGLIRSRIIERSIKSAKELFRDLLLLANNALVFYSRRTREYKSASTLRQLVMKEYKQQCRGGSWHEESLGFLPFNPPVKPRSARPRQRPPCKDEVAGESLSNFEDVNVRVDNITEELEKPCESSDCNVSLRFLLKGKKGLKRLEKVWADTQPKSSPVKQSKRAVK